MGLFFFMKILAIDLGSYKTVLASSDTSAGEIVLTETERRSTKMSIDYRGKIRQFGDINVSCKEREKVVEKIREEIENVIAQQIELKETGKIENITLPSVSHVYGLLSNLILHYTQSRGIALGELEVVVIVPSTYSQLHKNIITKMLNMIHPKIARDCITDSIALSAYYLSRRSTEQKRLVLFVDVGEVQSTATMTLISNSSINILKRCTSESGGLDVTNHLLSRIYNGLDRSIPDLFSADEFRIRNIKKIEWIKGAISGLPSVSTQVDASYEKSVHVTITQDDINEVEERFDTLFDDLSYLEAKTNSLLKNIEENEEINQDIEIELTGGSSRLFFIEKAIQKIFKKKPEVHLNADESIALGGVYMGLMESVFHRFRYDPFVTDLLNYMYYITVSDPAGNRLISVFDCETSLIKETKSKLLSKSYDNKVVIRHSPMKTVKITKVSEESRIVVWGGHISSKEGHPVYLLKLKPKPEEPKEDEKDKKQKLSESTEKSKKQRSVKLVMKLTSTGDIEVSSEDIEMVNILDSVNFSAFKRAEDAYVQKEKLVQQIRTQVNTMQAAMFQSIELLSGELSSFPSADRVMAALWDYTQSVDSLLNDAQSLEEVKAFSEKVEKELSLQKEWNAYAAKTVKEVCNRSGIESTAVTPPEYPGAIFLFSPKAYAQKEVEKEIRKQEEIRHRAEQIRKQKEEEERIRKQREEEQLKSTKGTNEQSKSTEDIKEKSCSS